MTTISAAQVKELREKTGLGLMDCKKALEGADGDIELAIEELRKTSGIKASKKSGRSAADGLVAITSKDTNYFMIEINCETDFVAKNDTFVEFATEIAKLKLNEPETDFEELRISQVAKIGENIQFSRDSNVLFF